MGLSVTTERALTQRALRQVPRVPGRTLAVLARPPGPLTATHHTSASSRLQRSRSANVLCTKALVAVRHEFAATRYLG